jgi:elongation factor P--(R)-beta-lysine ligase
MSVKRRALLTERAKIVAQIRAFFASEEFLEVETPTLLPSPGLDVHLAAFEVRTARGTRYLSTSPEYQMKRLLVDGWPKIFQIAKAYRQEELGDRHNPEFTILEWYRAPAEVDHVMRDTEQLVLAVTGGRIALGDREVDTRPPLERITVCDAFARFAGTTAEETIAMAGGDEDRFFRLLVDAVEPALARMDRAVFLTEYPAPQASLARTKPGDARVAERFELYAAGVELCNGFGELTDPEEQRRRFFRDQAVRQTRGLPVYPVDERFLAALERGLPACAGNALGVDRLVALACGTTSIREVMAFADDEL